MKRIWPPRGLVCVWWKVAIGIVIVVFTLRELFQDLFHPTRSGALSDWVGHSVFRGLRRWPSLLATAGPLSVVVVIFTWAALLVLGFAFIYWSVFPAEFLLKTATQPAGADGFLWSVYYSLEMLTTLGLGDIQPNPTWLKLLSATHTLIGFSLVTASITWIVLLFPALRRTRTLARKAHTLDSSEASTGVSVVSPGMHVIVAGLAEEVIRVRVDLVHFPILFYFYAEDPRASLAHALIPLMRFAEQGTEADREGLVRLAATGLQTALRDLAETVGERLNCEDRSPAVVFQSFAELHLN